VAGAGVGAGVTNALAGELAEDDPDMGIAARNFVSGMAGDIANAATRTLISGTDFGDNILKVLPDTIGETIGNAVATDSSQPTTFTDDDGNTVQVTPPSSLPQALTEAVVPYAMGQLDTLTSENDELASPITNAAQMANSSGHKVDWVNFTATAWDSNGTPTAGTLDTYVWNDSTNRDDLVSSRQASSLEMLALGPLDTLGSDVAGLGSQSPTLMSDIENVRLKYPNYLITDQWKQSGGRTSLQYQETDIGLQGIMDPASMPSTDADQAAAAAAIIGQLSHEIGHAMFGPIDNSSPSAFIQSNELSEGAATLSNIKIATEIQNVSGTIIPIQGDSDNIQSYINTYNQYAAGPQTASALQAAELSIGQTYATHEYPAWIQPDSAHPTIDFLQFWNMEYAREHPSTKSGH
jgi:hypothetical protein